ncbi:hypothetical protein D3C78_1575030 [compost metagenome]
MIKDAIKLPDALEKAFDFGGVRTMDESIANGEHLLGGSTLRAVGLAFKNSEDLTKVAGLDYASISNGI